MTIKLMCSFILSFLFATAFGKYYIPWLHRQKANQEIKSEVTWHKSKSGTPTMGGVMFILGVLLSILTIGFPSMMQGKFVHLFVFLFALVFGAIGFLDDWEKIKNAQNLGLTAGMKFLLQLSAALVFIFLMRRIGIFTARILFACFILLTTLYFLGLVMLGTPTTAMLYGGIVLMWMSYGMATIVVYTSAMECVRPGREGTDFTVQTVLTHLSGIIMAGLSGAVADHFGYYGLFLAEVIIASISLVYIILLFRKPHAA